MSLGARRTGPRSQGQRARAAALVAIFILLATACTDAEADPPGGGREAAPATSATPASFTPSSTATGTATATATADSARLVTERPYRLVEPSEGAGETARPLIVVLHGYGQGSEFDPLGLEALAEQEGALLGVHGRIARRPRTAVLERGRRVLQLLCLPGR